MTHDEARIRADILKALAHPIRVMLVEALNEGDRTVAELNVVAAVDQSTISRHLSQLRKAGIVSARRDGMSVVCHLETPCILRAFHCAAEVIRSDAARKTRLLRAG
jgi:ArsR family transcriptional regulator